MSSVLKKPAVAGRTGMKSPAMKRPASQAEDVQPPAKRLRGADDVLKKLRAYIVNLERRQDRWKRVSSMLDKELPWLKYERFKASDGTRKPIPEKDIANTWNSKNNAVYGDYFMWTIDGTKDNGKMWRWAAETPEADDKDWQFKENSKTEFLYIRDAPNFEKARTKTAVATNRKTGKRLNLNLKLDTKGETMKMSGGERGCAHSHLRLWRVAAGRSDNTLVLEDDVHLNFDRSGGKGTSNGRVFTKRLELALKAAPADFDVIYLGWSGWRGGHHYRWKKYPEDPATAKVIRKAEYVWTTVAYVISPAGAKKLLKRAAPMNQPVDNFMAWEASQGRLNSYVALDEGDDDDTWSGGIVDQFDFQGDSDIKKSDGGVQGDDAQEFAL